MNWRRYLTALRSRAAAVASAIAAVTAACLLIPAAGALATPGTPQPARHAPVATGSSPRLDAATRPYAWHSGWRAVSGYTVAQLAAFHAFHLSHLAHLAHRDHVASMIRLLAAQRQAAAAAQATARQARTAGDGDSDRDDGGSVAAPAPVTAPAPVQHASAGDSDDHAYAGTSSSSSSDGGGGNQASAHSGGYSAPSGGMYGCGALESLWISAGGSSGAAVMAASIAMAESGGNPNAISPTSDYGLWQINSSNGALSTLNPYANARAAITLSGNGSNWGAWTTYTSGAYQGKC